MQPSAGAYNELLLMRDCQLRHAQCAVFDFDHVYCNAHVCLCCGCRSLRLRSETALSGAITVLHRYNIFSQYSAIHIALQNCSDRCPLCSVHFAVLVLCLSSAHSAFAGIVNTFKYTELRTDVLYVVLTFMLLQVPDVCHAEALVGGQWKPVAPLCNDQHWLDEV
jgi:uncharacterized MnhB-related membrane protein